MRAKALASTPKAWTIRFAATNAAESGPNSTVSFQFQSMKVNDSILRKAVTVTRTDRKSQRPSDSHDRYTTNKADITAGTIRHLRPNWTVLLEHQDAISILVPELSKEEISIWFGPLNETWGAGVMTV